MSRQRLDLEFAPDRRKHALSTWLVLGVVAGGLALLSAQVVQRLDANARQRNSLSQMEHSGRPAIRKLPTASRGDPAEAARLQWALQTSRRLSTPWADLFAALESAPANVALLAVEPSAATRSVFLTAEAANATEMLDYLQALHRDARLAHVMLTSHAVQQQSPGAPLRFEVRADWGGKP